MIFHPRNMGKTAMLRRAAHLAIWLAAATRPAAATTSAAATRPTATTMPAAGATTAAASSCHVDAFKNYARRYNLTEDEQAPSNLEAYCRSAAHVAESRRNFGLRLNARAHLPVRPCRRESRASELPTSCTGPEGAPAPAAARESVDWRAEQALSPIKNQGQCGSCWAFATVEAVESALFLEGLVPEVPTLATQPLLDCDSQDSACQGGNPARALGFLDRAGDCLDAEYPYEARSGACRLWEKRRVLPSHDLACAFVAPEPRALEAALTRGPVIAGVAANSPDFQLYASGVFDGVCGARIDHAVTLVGYSASYWILRNSWGAEWGEQGFMRMSREVARSCGLLEDAVAVTARGSLQDMPILV